MPTPPAGFSISIPTGPAPNYDALIANDPWHLQNMEWMTEDAAVQRQRLEQDKLLAQQLYDINKQQASRSASGGGDYGMAAAQAQAGLARETAAHDDKLREEQIREIMASRGMYDSGQKQFEQQERQYDLSTLLKGIDIDLEGRASAAASARSQAQAGLALQLQEMALRHGASMSGYGDALADLERGLTRGRGESAFDTYKRLLASGGLNAPTMNAVWDDASGLYRASNGQYYDAAGNPVSWTPPAAAAPVAAAPAAPAPYTPPPWSTYVPPPGTPTDYGPPLPQMPRPGQPYIAY